MKIIVAALTFLTLSFYSYAQDATKKETQDWIKEKLELYAYQDDGKTEYKYKISFDDKNIIVDEELMLDIMANNLIQKTIIPIKNLMQITFEEKQNNVWMYFKIRGNNKEIKCIPKEVNEVNYESKYQLLLSKSIDDENLRPRITKAFKHLVKLYGGVVTKEKF